MPKASWACDPHIVRRLVMRGRLMFGVGTLAAVLAAGSCKDDVGLTSIPPAPERYIAFLSGANEPTPITTAAQGLATVTVNGDSIHYRIELSNIDSAFESSILKWIESPLTDRKSTRLNSSHSQISYAVFCLKKKKKRR